MEINLVIVWALAIIFGLSMYVVSDGFDLGVGMLFLAVRNTQDRETMVRSTSCVWDGSEAWLLLVAVCLVIAFPPTLSILIAAFSVPLIGVFCGLVVRGIAFKLRANNSRFWDVVICISSALVAFLQGTILGALVDGVSVQGGQFTGGFWSWFTWFSILTGVTLMLTYALLGATWLLVTTKGALYSTMRRYAHHLLVWFGYAMTTLTLITPFLNEEQRERWLGLPNFFYMGFVPTLGIMAFVWVYFVIRFSEWQRWPFAITLIMLGTAFFTYITSLWPTLVLPDVSIYEMATGANLEHTLWMVLVLVIAIASYSIWAFKTSLERAKSSTQLG